MEIFAKIMACQNTNFCRIFVSGDTNFGTMFSPEQDVRRVVVRYVGNRTQLIADKVNRLMFEEGYYFSNTDKEADEFTFLKA